MAGSWYGIPREEVPWHPTVDSERCIGCRACIDFCANGVYAWDDERQRSLVASPTSCVVGCSSCQEKCPTGAISFPTLAVLRDLLASRRRLSGGPA